MNWLCIVFCMAITLLQDALYVQTEHRITVDGRERTFVAQEPKDGFVTLDEAKKAFGVE